MNWVKLAILILEIAGAAVRWIEENKIASEAERRLIEAARGLTDANVARAEAARARVRARIDADPGQLRPPDDPYRRR
jgi:hypothetical protein